MDLGIDGNAALVSASSSGLGKAAATALAREGANVVVNGRDEERLDAAVEDIREVAEGEVVGQPADLTDPDDIEQLVQRTVDEFGGLDHLVTNAGGPPSKPFSETTDEEWYQAYDLLVMSVVRLVRESVDHLEESDAGSIVSSTSHSVKEAIDDLVLSNSVRMGVIGLEKTLSRELAPDVRVNAVMPGAHETDRMVYLIENAVEQGRFDSFEESEEAWTDDIPMGDLGSPAEFGNVVAFLLSDRASFINGESVMIDGGDARSNL
ncbi:MULTISPECIES: SDR family oxidoreductase [Halorussus]|uniref:SDR family oxidoreductase n=1 Tax=Halorussus TaxID=1070314 RepID=UPI000E214820|nr:MULTISPECIES: SDR family oxidoreductase [Halorussus]NHN61662.1 SDR family oxidoreductase [Halorussus sp. JP-T4]